MVSKSRILHCSQQHLWWQHGVVKNSASKKILTRLLIAVLLLTGAVVGIQLSSGTSTEELRALWRSWIPDFRILCLTESPAHSAMWFHYADQYKGAVLEFNCSDELDSAWLVAEPVTYPASKPEVFEANGWAKLMMMPREVAIKTIFRVSTYTKSPDWSYENEWRITSFKRPNDTGLFTDYKFDSRELSAVYLGPLMSVADKASLIELATKYPHIKIFEVAIGMSREFLFSEKRI